MSKQPGASAAHDDGAATQHVTKPLRADARRNQARVLEVAERLLATYGAAVSFDEIAREAGVGVGTVYRHIPIKEDLLRAVITDGMQQLAAEARLLANTAEDPTEAFFGFFRRMADQTAINKALCEAFEGDVGSRLEPELRAERDFLAALGELLAHAQRTGGIRDDLDAADVRALVVGSMMMERTRGDLEFPGRMIKLVSGVLRADRPCISSPTPVVTKQDAERQSRNEMPGSDLRRNENPEVATVQRCEMCGEPLRVARQGRPARFCGASCRQKAHRRRHTPA